MKRKDIFGKIFPVHPLLLQLFKVVGPKRHDRNINADLGLAHLSPANDHVLHVDFAPLERADVTLA